MGKKIIVAITILLIAGLFTGWYLFTREVKYLGTSAYRAMPENSAAVIRVHHFKSYTSQSLINPMWKSFSDFPGIASLYQKLSFADSLFTQLDQPGNTFNDKDLTIVFQSEGDQIHLLTLIEFSTLSEKKIVTGIIGNYFIRKGIPEEKSRFGEAEIYCYKWQVAGSLAYFYTSVFRGLFLGSSNRKFLELAINRLENPGTGGNSIFDKANKSSSGNIDAQIYLNHKKLPQISKQLFSENFWERLKGSAPLADWSEIDLTQKQNELILNGFSFISDSLSHHLGLFLHQKPDSFSLARIFPSESTYFLGCVINDNNRFFQDYEQLLSANHCLDSYKRSMAEIDSTYGIDLKKLVINHLDGAAALVYTQPDPTMSQENRYLVLKVNSGSQTEEELTPLAIQIPPRKKRDKPKNYTLYEIDQETSFKIYQTSVNDLGKRIFGELFGDVTTNYYTIFDNCLVMSSSIESIGRFLKANVLQETLGNNQTYRKFTSELSDRLNVYLWISPGRAIPFFKELFRDKVFQNFVNKRDQLLKIESFGWQIGNENGMIYNMARLRFNPVVPENPTTLLWKSHIGNSSVTKLQMVVNPSDKSHPEIIVQDGDFNLLLTTFEGRVLWKTKLKGVIIGEIVQLNCFNNGELQYFFSTSDGLHMIGHDGNELSNFPVTLRSPATNGVMVADYEHNRDYRFFIAGKDNKVLLFDKKGKAVTGWTPPKAEHKVSQPIQYFRIGNKDYLVFADKNRIYILDRKGKPIVNIKENLTFSQNPFTLIPKSGKNGARIVSTDLKGRILSIGFDGSVRKLEIGDFSPDHRFSCFMTFPGNGLNYLILDGETLSCYNATGNRLFIRNFNHPILTPPQLFNFPDRSIKIGITDSAENKIYLLNSDGTVYNGFPLEGNSQFSLTFQGNKMGPFNLLTGTSAGDIINYKLK